MALLEPSFGDGFVSAKYPPQGPFHVAFLRPRSQPGPSAVTEGGAEAHREEGAPRPQRCLAFRFGEVIHGAPPRPGPANNRPPSTGSCPTPHVSPARCGQRRILQTQPSARSVPS